MLRRVPLLAVLAVATVGCAYDDACLDPACRAYLSIVVAGFDSASAPLHVEACDGDYCSTYDVMNGACEYAEPTDEPAFRICFASGTVTATRDLSYVPDREPPPVNDTVSIAIVAWEAPAVFEREGVPELVDLDSCGGPCAAREITF